MAVTYLEPVSSGTILIACVLFAFQGTRISFRLRRADGKGDGITDAAPESYADSSRLRGWSSYKRHINLQRCAQQFHAPRCMGKNNLKLEERRAKGWGVRYLLLV